MKTNSSRISIIALACMAIVPVLFATGCLAVAAAGAGAGTVAYVRGDLQTTLEAPVARAHEAANLALAELGYHQISDEVDALSAKIVARTAQDKKVQVRLNEATPNTSELSIRVGVFGDEQISRAVLSAIEKRL